jgi:hypothetical protein
MVSFRSILSQSRATCRGTFSLWRAGKPASATTRKVADAAESAGLGSAGKTPDWKLAAQNRYPDHWPAGNNGEEF